MTETKADRDVASPNDTPLTVSDVAKLTGVSVRTLHHYDEIGLLRHRTS